MFDGMPSDQFHQFMASRTSLPIPLSFSLHENPSFSASLDPYPSSLNSQALEQLHHHHQESPNSKDIGHIDGKHHGGDPFISTSLALERERSIDPWSNDEVLALLKVRSTMEIWFPDFTWEHISRKLGELGFKRSAEQCKERFEEESKHFNTVNYNKNYRILSELDELYPADDQEEARISAGRSTRQNMEKQDEVDQEEVYKNVDENPSQESEDQMIKKPVKSSSKKKIKKKRKDRFKIFKGFCQAVVNKMMAQQEELHNKLIEDIVKRDEEKIAREEAWKNQEMDRIKMEIEMRAKEQTCAGERQATLIKFLKKFTSEDRQHFAKKIEDLANVNNSYNSFTSPCEIFQTIHQFPAGQEHKETSTSSSMIVVAHQNHPSFPSENNPKRYTKTPSLPSPSSSLATILDSKANISITNDSPFEAFTSSPSTHLDSTANHESGDINTGKRWPRDEVLALINLRCKMSNNGDESNNKEGAKGPLWERISQGMMELGYKRNAKRCKEKWENINKYFRKTKDSNKKRSVNSRTCPYFHQLSCLYSDGTVVVAPTVDVPENQ